MDYRGILREIRRHTWWSEDGPCHMQYLFYQLRCFVTMSRLLKAPYFSIAAMIMKGDDFFYERTPMDERETLYDHYFSSMKKDKGYINRHIKITGQRKKAYFSIINDFVQNRKKMSNKELWGSYKKFMDKYVEWLHYPAAIECIDAFTTTRLEGIARGELPQVSNEEFREILQVLAIPKKLSFMEEERVDFLRICLDNFAEIKSGRANARLMAALEAHSRKHFFVLNNFKTVRYLGAKHFLVSAREAVKEGKPGLSEEYGRLKNKVPHLKKKAAEIYKKYKISNDLKLHFRICEIFGKSIDNRKATMMRTNNNIRLYCEEIARRAGADAGFIEKSSFNEIGKMLLSGSRPGRKAPGSRKGFYAVVYLMSKNKEGVEECEFYGSQAEEILRLMSHKAEGEIRGHVASAPVEKLRGKVQVVFDVSKTKFQKGRILVTTMTRPEFVPLMRKAAAIITDEGGITCHAAIVSRELRIPCIIGTKVATKLLKSGDVVEIDCVSGVVRKIQ